MDWFVQQKTSSFIDDDKRLSCTGFLHDHYTLKNPGWCKKNLSYFLQFSKSKLLLEPIRFEYNNER